MSQQHEPKKKLTVFEPCQPLNQLGFLHTRWRGKVYPPFMDLNAIRTLCDTWETDEHDVFISTHQKVGTHLTKKYMVEILRTAISYPEWYNMGSGDIGHGTVPWPEVTASQHGIEYFRSFLEKTAGYPRPWYAHCFVDDMPAKHIHPKSKFIVCLRDPRGAAVSQYFFYRSHPLLDVSANMTMDEFVDIFVGGDLYFGDYHLHALNWIESAGKQIPRESLLFLRYEDLVERKMEVAQRIARFLVPDVPITREQFEAIVQSTGFETMKQGIKENPGSFHFNPDTFFRSGKTRDWEAHLSEKAVAAIDSKTRRLWGDDLVTPPLNGVQTLEND
ncbi:MAG: sulfotransferase domain-containing protein [Bacteroidota bacterium]|jgi:hypothetical protein